MSKTFYNILVPVDFTGKNKWAISKAIELANTFHCNIHLLHVVSNNLLPLLPIETSLNMPGRASEITFARRGNQAGIVYRLSPKKSEILQLLSLITIPTFTKVIRTRNQNIPYDANSALYLALS